MKIALISVTKSGNKIADKLKEKYDVDLYSTSNIKNFNLRKVTKNAMKNYRALIFVSSTGIAVRAIANFIESKDKDPAVIVIDSCKRFVISLLSGHIGGANKLTNEIANMLEAEPVITTATDNMGIIAPDVIAVNNDLEIDNLKIAKNISALLVNRKKVYFKDEEGIINCPKGYTSEIDTSDGIVVVTNKISPFNLNSKNVECLKLIRKNIVLGIGCKKNFDAETMKTQVINVLKEKNIDKRAVCKVATVDLKASESAILHLKDYLKCNLEIFSRESIKRVQHKFEGSDFVEKTIGVRGVCEPCAYLAGAVELTEKMKLNGMTLCIGKIK
ncbi:cobalt-precorrin 5A hydrolase [Clostridium sp. cel8]|uniref:cobalt-precorrin 5A hydrolase n=1 Tax=Clostridium sp. cel8 TaxID=2663123 RepID=UPI0015F49F86|nr:cobalt-precorrin 5A hydrolase [Clostridium sp. cel8]MBA5850982.1 cobalt-precorrin 5A hydrolase [Clostridium sp. cel8]